MRTSIVFTAVILLMAIDFSFSTVPVEPVASSAYAEGDLLLLHEKCGACHGWRKSVESMKGRAREERIVIVERMREKKPGWISDEEASRINGLLSGDDPAGLSSAVESLGLDAKEEEDSKEHIIEPIKIAHGLLQAGAFFLLGIYMTLTGLKRRLDGRKINRGNPVKFNWKKHVLRGKIYVLLVLAGFGGGLTIWALDGFSMGEAKPHYIAGAVVAVLYAIGGLIGLRLERGRAPAALKTVHMVCNLAATLIFVFSIVSGIMLAMN